MAKNPGDSNSPGDTAGDWFFPEETLRFLGDLRRNNDRGWFAARKTVFERAVKQPSEMFRDLMVDELARARGQTHTAKIFRIHRDVRFAKDKTPYNTHIHISFFAEPSHGLEPAWFFGLDPDSLSLGVGNFAFDKGGLRGFRDRVGGDDGKDLTILLSRLVGDGARVGEPELKRVPTGFDPDHPRADLLRRKGLSAWIDLAGPGVATEPGFIAECSRVFARFRPLAEWMEAA